MWLYRFAKGTGSVLRQTPVVDSEQAAVEKAIAAGVCRARERVTGANSLQVSAKFTINHSEMQLRYFTPREVRPLRRGAKLILCLARY